MKLTDKQIERFFQYINSHQEHKYGLNIRHIGLEGIVPALRFIQKKLDGYINFAAIVSDLGEYEKHLCWVVEILKASLYETEGGVGFHQAVALEKCLSIQSRIYSAELGALHAQSSNLGIQEKYLAGILLPCEWLIDLDLQRSIDIMDLRDVIKVTRATVEDIGMQLHLSRQSQPDKPITVCLLLNDGSEGRKSGMHWFSAIIKVEPSTKKASYVVNNSFPLSPAKKRELEQLLESAIEYDVTEGASHYQAFPAFTICPDKSIETTAEQTDGFSYGYRALHGLLQQQVLEAALEGKQKADAYKRCSSDSMSLMHHMYQLQLENLQVPKDVVDTHVDKNIFQQSASAKSSLTQDSIRAFLSDVDDNHNAFGLGKTVRTLNQNVFEKIKKFKAHDPIVRFSIDVANGDEPMTHADCLHYFTSIHEKLESTKQKIATLVLTPCKLDVLIGFNAYLASYPARINKLVLEVDTDKYDEKSLAAYETVLKTLIFSASAKGLPKVEFKDASDNLSREFLDRIKRFVELRACTVEITLPEKYRNTELQYELDKIIDKNRWNERLEVADSAAERYQRAKTVAPKPKRTRRDVSAVDNLAYDIELQQEQQLEVAVAHTKINVGDHEDDDHGTLSVINCDEFDKFHQKLKNNEFKLPESTLLVSDDDVKTWWDVQFGHLSSGKLNNWLSGVTYEAIKKLYQNKDKLGFGFDRNHLPLGFSIIEYPVGTGSKVLHYDALVSQMSQRSDELALNLENPQQKSRTPMCLVDMMLNVRPSLTTIWKSFEKESYDRDGMQTVQYYFNTLIKFSDEQVKEIFKLSTIDGKLNPERFRVLVTKLDSIRNNADGQIARNALTRLFANYLGDVIVLAKTSKPFMAKENHPLFVFLKEEVKIHDRLEAYSFSMEQLDELFQVVLARGYQELDRTLDAWDAIPATLKNIFKDHPEVFNKLGTEEINAALMYVEGYSGAKLQWWQRLLQRHSEHARIDNFAELVDAFNTFSQIIIGKGLDFEPLQAGVFADVRDMQVAMARMLTILQACHRDDIFMQWKAIPQLFLSSAGALRCFDEAEKDGFSCGYVCPEMQMQDAAAEGKYSFNALANLNKFHDIMDELELKHHFYATAAKARHRLPAEFYRDAYQKLSAMRLSFESVKQMTAVLLLSTLGAENSHQLAGEEESAHQWQAALDTIKNIQSPLPIYKDEIIKSTIDALYRLGSVPPLPMTLKLMQLCASATHLNSSSWNISAVKKELEKNVKNLTKACNELSVITKYHGQSVYEGMKFYPDAAYNVVGEGSIFYSHLEIAKAIVEMRYRDDGGSRMINTDYARLLLKLVSTFNISVESVQILSYLLKNMYSCHEKRSVLELLPEININKNDEANALSCENLVTFFADLEALQGKGKAIDVLENHFTAYFEDDFFVKLKAQAIPQNVITLINDNFSEDEAPKISLLLNRFNRVGDVLRYEGVVRNLIAIAKAIPDGDRDGFLSALSNDRLFGDAVTIQKFEKLLDAVMERGGVGELLYFLAQPECEHADCLMEKATRYLQDILQTAAQLRDHAYHKLAAKLVLQTKEAEFSADYSTIGLNAQEQLQKLKNYLLKLQKAEEQNLADVLEKLEYFRGNSVLAPQVEALQDHINVLIMRQEDSKKHDWIEVVTNFLYLFVPSKPKPRIDDKYINKILEHIEAQIAQHASYKGSVADLLPQLKQLADKFSGAKDLLQDFMGFYISNCDGDVLKSLWTAVEKLEDKFSAVDIETVRGLLFHYSKTHGQHTPDKLIKLIVSNEFIILSQSGQSAVLKAMTCLLNNDKGYEPDELTQVIKLAANHNGFMDLLKKFFTTPPYPTFEMLLKWHESCENDADYPDAMQKCYEALDKTPCARDPNNGLDLQFAYEQAEKFAGIEILRAEVDDLKKQIDDVQGLSVGELVAEFGEFHSKLDIQLASNARLLALAAELLYRSKGQEGQSFELNTTQYLSLYATLKSGGHTTSRIATGEGKSRIMAVANACLFAQGKTVDFVTSDVQLATRDYLEFQAYFKAIGAKTSIIYGDSSTADYCVGGINYSDASSLSLFRNRARSCGKGNLVINAVAEKRALALDEADKSYFDVFDTRYNYSAHGDASLQHMEWIYPILIDFFSDESHMELYKRDIDACNEKFLTACKKVCDNDVIKKARLMSVTQEQIETWHDSAVKALVLQEGRDFAVFPDVEIHTPQGPKIASEARLIIKSRISKNAKLSLGVQQCLHARLNKEKRADCKYPFHISSEKQIIYSSNSKGLLDDYAKGDLVAVTGTIGSIMEQEEAELLYAQDGGKPMQFVEVPRQHGNSRADHSVHLTANNVGQLDALAHYIQEAQQNNQPVLIFCEDDQASEKLFTALGNRMPSLHKQHIHSKMTYEEEKEAIAKAGQPDMVTFSTEMVGRGTDIKLAPAVKENGYGLRVLRTYLPRERDDEQMKGRSGRQNDPRDTRMVLDMEKLKRQFGEPAISTGLFTSTETFIRRLQAMMDRKEQCKRLVKYTAYDFDRQLTENFYNDLLARTTSQQHMSLVSEWMTFSREKDQLWDKQWPNITAEFKTLNPDVTKIEAYLAEYRAAVKKLWSNLTENVDTLNLLPSKDVTHNRPLISADNFPELHLDNKAKALLGNYDLEQRVPLKVKLHDTYDPAHKGRAVVYKTFAAMFKAWWENGFGNVRAWLNGVGVLFPYLQAWFRGELTFQQAFLGVGSDDDANVNVTQVNKSTLFQPVDMRPDDPKVAAQALAAIPA